MSALRSSASARVAVAGRQRDADAGADDEFVAVHFVGLAHDLDQRGGERARFVGIAERKLHDGEFVAAETRDHVAVAQAFAEPLRHGLQQLVADRMAERVVDAFEMIEIEAVHREALAAARRTRASNSLSRSLNKHAVGQIGQRIVMRHIGDARFGLLALGDVDDRDQNRDASSPNGTRRA